MLARAILAGASAQVRNMATVGGNVLQRTRCTYFYDDDSSRCNKRTSGKGCDTIGGFNRIHVVLGSSHACIATHPSDMCVALAAVDATVHLSGPQGGRKVPLTEFHRLPGDTPHLETVLQPGELNTAVELPPLDFNGRSTYRKVRDRANYALHSSLWPPRSSSTAAMSKTFANLRLHLPSQREGRNQRHGRRLPRFRCSTGPCTPSAPSSSRSAQVW